MKTQTEPVSLTSQQILTKITATPPNQNYVLHLIITSELASAASNQVSHCKANQASTGESNINVQSIARPCLHNSVFIVPFTFCAITNLQWKPSQLL